MKRSSITHEFVGFVPRELEEGVLYVSIPYATAVHRCACGCGNKVVTPISPAEWHLIFDGDAVSLTPSIGNWQLPCRSHYFIRWNEIQWARRWSAQQIADGLRRDESESEMYFADRENGGDTGSPDLTLSTEAEHRRFRWIKQLLHIKK